MGVGELYNIGLQSSLGPQGCEFICGGQDPTMVSYLLVGYTTKVIPKSHHLSPGSGALLIGESSDDLVSDCLVILDAC